MTSFRELYETSPNISMCFLTSQLRFNFTNSLAKKAMPMTQNRDQPEVQLYVGTFEVYVLARLNRRHPGKFPR